MVTLEHQRQLLYLLTGLFSPAGGDREESTQDDADQVKEMIRTKISQKEYTILCLESQDDWANAPTRGFVKKVPACKFSRTKKYISLSLFVRLSSFNPMHSKAM